MPDRITCHRFASIDDAAAARIAATQRPNYLTEHGWHRLTGGDWTHPSTRAVFTTAAAVRTQLREDRTR
jgi:hypothetical protein